jgi:DNA-directed RNA polymerase subunit beta
MVSQYLAEDIVDMETGEIYAEAGEEITEELLEQLIGAWLQVVDRCSTSTTSTPARTSATR